MIKELFTEKKWKREGSVFWHRQVFNGGGVYIYAVSLSEDMRQPYYEVFKRRIVSDIKVVDGKFKRIDDSFHVKYPANEDFGRWAKNCVTLDDAMEWVRKWSSEPQK